ncbi:hypothetical protein [Paenibacillus sp. KN14-4R]|uniref:hypothetical protein n=1 Tax=Paenibacillus sp. KN14-4R TaxID=3445773 RepID=UPI003FA1278D
MKKRDKHALFVFGIFAIVTVVVMIFLNNNRDVQPDNSLPYLDSNSELKFLLEGESTQMKGMKVSIGRQEDPVNYVSIPNHSEELYRETINLPTEQVHLIKFKHGGPAANPSPDSIMYWIYAQRVNKEVPKKTNTYYIEATVSIDNEMIKKELLKIAESWKLPK